MKRVPYSALKISPDTLLRVTIAERGRTRPIASPLPPVDYGKPELFCIVPFKHLSKVLKLKHVDAERRVKRELEEGVLVAFLYETIGAYGEMRRFGIEVRASLRIAVGE